MERFELMMVLLGTDSESRRGRGEIVGAVALILIHAFGVPVLWCVGGKLQLGCFHTWQFDG